MKIFDSRKSIVLASIGVLFATLALVSCEKREEPLLNEMAKYSKTIVFTEQQQQTRASYIDYTTAMPSAEYVLRTEEATDSLFLSEYVTDLATEEYMTRATEATLDNLSQFYVLAYDSNGELVTELSKSVVPTDEAKTEWHYSPDINWSELGNRTINFYAYANIVRGTAEQVDDSKFKLTLSKDPTQQTDIIVAKAEKSYNSSTTEQVPLNFNHICAGVKFVTDFDKQGAVGGTINSITISGIMGTATYDVLLGSWSNHENSVSVSMTGFSETFMIIPQTLGPSAKISVNFTTNGGNNHILEKSLQGYTWEAGKMYTYKITTSQIQLLDFIEVPVYRDAHYEIVPIKIKVSDRDANGKAISNVKLTATASDGATIELRERLTSYEEDGYWIDNSSYSTYIKSDVRSEKTLNITKTGEFFVYLFLSENITGTDRTITLELTADNANSRTISFKQFCPTSTGCERIEENPYVAWGPYWEIKDKDGKNIEEVTYSATWQSVLGGLDKLWGYILLNFRSDSDWPKGVKPNKVNVILIGKILTGVTIDYGEYITYDQTGNDGLDNTKDIFGGGENSSLNIDEILQIEEELRNSGLDLQDGVTIDFMDMDDLQNSAILSSVKKNKYSLSSVGSGNDITYYPTINSNNIVWYLPSITEIPTAFAGLNGHNNETPFSGTYWSSTTSTVNSTANSMVYDWTNKIELDVIRTNNTHKYRAVRAGFGDGNSK